MTDRDLIDALFARRESALAELQARYAAWCGGIIARLLQNESDTQEALNDLWLQVWNSIPPARPDNLRAYLARAARNTALHYLEREGAGKRKHVAMLLSELSDCLPDPAAGRQTEGLPLREALNAFVRGLRPAEREIFVRRYWYGESIAELQERTGWSRSRITSLLQRLRRRLKKHLEQEGVWDD